MSDHKSSAPSPARGPALIEDPTRDPAGSSRGAVAARSDGWPASRWSTVLAGGVFLASGAALVAHVVWGLPLPLVFAAVVVGAGVLGALAHPDAPVAWWGRHRRLLLIGLVAGVVSTAAYDLSRWVLV